MLSCVSFLYFNLGGGHSLEFFEGVHNKLDPTGSDIMSRQNGVKRICINKEGAKPDIHSQLLNIKMKTNIPVFGPFSRTLALNSSGTKHDSDN